MTVAKHYSRRHEWESPNAHPLCFLEGVTAGVLSLLLQLLTGTINRLVDVALSDKNRQKITSSLRLLYGREPVKR